MVLLRAVANVVEGNVVGFVIASNTELLPFGLEFRLVIIVAIVVTAIDVTVEFIGNPILDVIPVGKIVLAICFITGIAVVVVAAATVVVVAVVFNAVVNAFAVVVVVVVNEKLIIDGGNGIYG